MRIYMDVCCLNRPFDDLTQGRVLMEAVAVELVLTGVEEDRHRLISSEVIEREIAATRSDPHRQELEGTLAVATDFVEVSPAIEARAVALARRGFKMMDALHVACAEAGAADVLLTTDDRFLRCARRNAADLLVRVENPTDWLREAWDEQTT